MRPTVILVLLTAAPLFSQDLTEKNWSTDPRIVSVRGIVAGIENDVTRGGYTHARGEKEYERPYEDVVRESWSDAAGRVRKLCRQAGSDDSALAWNFYYDAGGRLRFVFITGGAVNGTRIEHRIYYDEYGDKLYEFQKLVAGPGYTFPKVWPDERLVFDPQNFPTDKW